MQNPAKVFLIGAGPGDPGLVTLRGLLCLARADYVLYDGLANHRLLQFAPKAEHICVGKHGKTPIWPQENIHQKMIELCHTGKQVVRLKGGDPAVFARTAEEAEALTAAGIAFEVVPGITSGLAVSSYVGIPLTHRDHASAVALVTGKQQSGSDESMDWEALARFPGTLVFYMGVTTAAHWTGQLIAAGKAADTPAAIVRRCTWPDQLSIRCTLGEVARELTPASKIRPPVAVVVGQVASTECSYTLGERSSFDATEETQVKRILEELSRSPANNSAVQAEVSGGGLPATPATVLLTASDAMNRRLEKLLQQHGIQSTALSILQHRTSSLSSDGEALLERLSSGQIAGITFSSQQGVNSFFALLRQRKADVRRLANVLLCCVGPATATALMKQGVIADVVPSNAFGAASLLKELSVNHAASLTKEWIVTSTNTSGHELADGIQAAGGQATELTTYQTTSLTELPADVSKNLLEGAISLATVTSSKVAESLHGLLSKIHRGNAQESNAQESNARGDNDREGEVLHNPANGRLEANLRVVALSDTIAEACRDLGLSVVGIAQERSSESLAEAIVEVLAKQDSC